MLHDAAQKKRQCWIHSEVLDTKTGVEKLMVWCWRKLKINISLFDVFNPQNFTHCCPVKRHFLLSHCSQFQWGWLAWWCGLWCDFLSDWFWYALMWKLYWINCLQLHLLCVLESQVRLSSVRRFMLKGKSLHFDTFTRGIPSN